MLGEICREIKNYFVYEEDKHIGKFVISGGQISPTFDFPTDYIRIIGSRLNDGVHEKKDGVFELEDEEFDGAIWVMSPPKEFLALVDEVKAWQDKNGGAESVNLSPFQSESFGGYSYSKGSHGSDGESTATWQSTFANRLNNYRRIRV